MKTMLSTMLVSLGVIGAAHAGDSVKFEYAYTDLKNVQGVNSLSAQYSHDFGMVTGDVKGAFGRQEETGSQADAIEFGATVPVYKTITVRGAVGRTNIVGLTDHSFKHKTWTTADTADYNYWSVEPAITVPVYGKVSAIGSYKYQDSLSDGIADKTNQYKVGAQYDFTKATFADATFTKVYGDAEANVFQVGYGVKF